MKLWPFNREGPEAVVRARETTEDNDALQPQISAFWSSLWSESAGATSTYAPPWSPRLTERVWTVNRCLQLTSQEIAAMPLRHFGSREPAWISNPDPVWFPNGIADAVFAATWSMYAYGDAFLYVTSRYVDGFPSAWTVLDAATMSVKSERGRRQYRSGNVELDPDDVVQISRDPRGGLRGTSALSSYSSVVWGQIGGAELGRTLVGIGGSVPNAVLKPKFPILPEEARALQDSWVAARQRSAAGTPAVVPPDVDFEQLAFSPNDLSLLELQQYDVRAIASAFSVPAFLLNMPLAGGLTYQSPEMLFEVWWRVELRPAAGRIQHALSNRMLPRGSWVEFDARAVLAPTFDRQVAAWLELKKEGVVTVDEVRAAVLHLPALEEGPALEELTEPPTAGASPSQTAPSIVKPLRPTAVIA
jgi:HK97 family phage portal protein